MNSRKINARKGGLLYLAVAITGGFGIMYIPTNIIIPEDAISTANNIINSIFTYRLSILSSLVSQVLMIFLVLSLSQLFKDVSQKLIKYMVILILVAVPISFINVLNLVVAQIFVSNPDYLSVFDPDQLKAMAMVFLNLYKQGISVVGIFWGLWLFPFGMLIIKSKFIPKIIGVLLIIGCFSYLVDSFTSLLFPEYKAIISPFITVPLAIGEFSTILWLLIKGTKEI